MRLVIGSDHAGFRLKGPVVEALGADGHEVIDVGTHGEEMVDFPDIATDLCQTILDGRAERGLMVCGTGVGACIAANKVPGVRAALCHDVYSARQCVEHDDVNVMCVGADIVGRRLAIELIQTFLKAEFSTEPHFRRRVAKLAEMEKRAAASIRAQVT